MFNKLFGKLSGDSRKKGFTMTELLVVIGIIAIVCAIAIPAIISMNKSLKFKQANEYAESIFMAAQANLTEMRSDGQLINLLTDGNGAEQIPSNVDFPEDHVANYRYATSEDLVYDVLVPKMSVDSEVRDGNVLIEYNPFTGNVYAVFYKDGGETLGYTEGDGVTKVTRNEDARRDLLLGYYCGSALSTEPLTPEETEAEINFDNGEEGIVEVSIPIPKSYKSRVNDFAHGLAVDLTVKGATLEDTDRNGETGSFTVQIKQAEPADDNWDWDTDGNKIIVTYTLDSLMNKQSFANYCQRSGEPIKKAPPAHVQPKSASNETGTEKSLTAIADESVFNIYPGENINISAEVTFKPSAEKASVNISTGSFDNANPMFDMLVPADGGDGYVLCVSNGRNLQNLNAIAPKIANKINTVAFTGDIDWNNTVTYYNNKAANGSYVNDSTEAPARALPYFVPIHNENLFGTAQFVYPSAGDNLWAKIKATIEDIFKINLNTDDDVPTLTDELDRQVSGGKYTSTPNTHATVSGAGHKVLNLKIDASKYALVGDFYALNTTGLTGINSKDTFTGLFGYVNTTIDGLSVVNPIIKGGEFSEYNNPATGALVGAAGFNTLITNCSTYIDTSAAAGFNRSLLPSGVTNNASGDSYGVKGSGAVGGLVGYAKSHRTVTGELTSDKSTLAFSNCFASVPVSGHMRGNADKHYGYTNGVGGLVGNAEISNFYNCYASGDVLADGVYVTNQKDATGAITSISNAFASILGKENTIDLLYNGRTSMGAGGFVGTSHGVRYTNCFASGDVLGKSSSSNDSLRAKGTAGFVGIMSYEETHAYGNDVNKINDKEHTDVAQMTVFQNCYAVGLAKSTLSDGAKNSENFSGANCRIKFDGFGGTATKYWSGSYYQVYAPWWFNEKGTVVNGIERLPYESFIFKDSYYISQYTSESSDQTNACASPVSYTNLTDLTAMQNSNSWISQQLIPIKNRSILDIIENIKGLVGTKDDDDMADAKWYNYRGVYFGEWVNAIKDGKPRYELPWYEFGGGKLARGLINDSVRIAKVGDKDNYATYYKNSLGSLEGIYTKLYKEGFPASEWDKGGTGSATHSYDTVVTGAYPFSKLKSTNGASMDYYGRWPAKKLAAGLAYYEQYSDGSYGYYFDRDQTSTLNNSKTIVSDGYAILSPDASDNITVTVGGNAYTLKNDGTYTATYTTENSVYYVHRLPWEALQNASKSEFYTQLQVVIKNTVNNKDTKETYTFYFNPNLALTQVNPVDDGKDGSNAKYNAVKPAKAPKQVYIRTARQLAAMSSSSMAKFVADKSLSFVQELDINAATYTGVDCTDNTPVEQFNASYSGRGYKEQASISGFDKPIFKTIGEDAKVSDLVVNCAGAHKSADNEAGLLASFNKGLVNNVDVSVAAKANVNAGTTAGLLIGVNSGTVSRCDATISAKATVTAGTNAGGIIGVNIGTVEKCTANITGTMTVNATNAGGFVGAALEGSKFEDVTVNGSNITGNGSVGAFAGSLKKTNADSVIVTVNGTARATDTAAGFAASVNGGTITGSTVTIAEGAAVSAKKSAAGLIGTANAANLSGLKLELKGSVTGTDSAVGAVTKITRGTTSSVNVVLNGGTISATAANGNAAGFTLDAVTHIELCNVSGEGTISANAANGNAAGFAVSVSENDVFNCVVSPADHTKTNLKNAYSASELADLTISATGANGNAAGFAVNVSGTITNSSALGTISGTNAAGFAVNVENSGSINACMANTDLVYNTGSPFAKTNSGLVANSYAWYKNGAVQKIDLDEGLAAHYSSCYFAPFRSTEPKPKPTLVTVVKGRAVEQISYEALAALEPEALGGESTVWQFAGKDDAYPFTNMRGAQYAYPMLHDHYGDWVNPAPHAYGVVYYEKSGNNIVSMDLVDLSVVTDTTAHPSYSFEKRLEDDNKPITETGYAVFYHNQTQIMIDGDGSVADYEKLNVTEADLTGLKCGDKDADITKFLKDYKFSIWPETKNAEAKQGIVINGLDGGKHMIVPAYADAIIKNWTAETAAETATYEIRTANQFANINADLGLASIANGYVQTHNFTLNGNSNIETFKSLSYDGGNHEITVGAIEHGLFGAVGTGEAKAEIKDVKLTGAVLTATKTAGIVADTVGKNGTITGVTLSKPRIEISADYTKDNNTIAIGAVAGTNEGTIENIKVETSKLTDIDGNVQKDAGEVMYIPFVIDASKTTLKNVALNLNIGGLVGSNTGTLTASNVKTDIEFTPVTAAPDADAEKTTLTQNVSFGGLVGYNTNTVEGTVTGDISLGSVALDNDGKEVTLTDKVMLGGLVGYSKSERNISASVGGTVTGDISYTRPAVVSDDKDATVKGKTVKDDVMLGGLVGYNHEGGTVAASASVTGTFAGKAAKTDETDKTIAIVKAQDIIVDKTDTSKNTYVLDASVSGNTYIGGLVGQMNGGSFGKTVGASGAVKLDYSVGESYTGGIAGYVNNSAVNNANTDLDITVSTANAELYAGGIVGKISDGSMNGGKASGELSINGSIDSANTFVGGAIGYEMGTTSFANVRAAVDINGSWSKTNHDNSVDCPSGYANVGKFVGHVTGGKFSGCSATGNSNLALQFLGTINKTKKTIKGSNYYSYKLAADEAFKNLTGTVEQWPNQTYIGKDAANKDIAFAKVNNGTIYYIFAAKLNNCVYTDKAGSEFYQTFKQIDSFYTLSNVVSHVQYEADKTVTAMTPAGLDYIIVDYTGKWALTADGGDVGLMQFDSVFEDDKSSIWTHEGDKKLRNNKSGISKPYLYVNKNVLTDKVKMDSDGQFLLEDDGNNFVRFYDTYKIWGKTKNYYMYTSNDSIATDTTSSTGNNTKFKLYTVKSTNFTRAAMTYSDLCDWACTSTPKT
ncbi:MAG: prepilin-type N-terminal cleavage/methylation domain-containing protein [Firmicutes bacterium]|nr:prepilin-type N-terminal cleavage/methylation domain-containing protein [Bacillota bacterium]